MSTGGSEQPRKDGRSGTCVGRRAGVAAELGAEGEGQAGRRRLPSQRRQGWSAVRDVARRWEKDDASPESSRGAPCPPQRPPPWARPALRPRPPR